MTARFGIDVGGTKIEAVALDAGGSELFRTRVPTPAGDYAAILTAIRQLVTEMSDRLPDHHLPVGVGSPGAISPRDGLMKNSNSTALNGRPFDRDLEEHLGRPVVLRNDADCFALSEAKATDADTVFGVIIGTGVGGGVIVGGQPLRGPNAIAGEWGHGPLPWPSGDELANARDCYCGKRGCLETWLSGPGFSAAHAGVTGESLTPQEIVCLARRGDPVAGESLRSYCDRLARGLAVVIGIVDPWLIVLGGGMSNVAEIYETVPARLGDYVFGGEVATELVPNKHGDSSGVLGAAMLVGQ